MTSSSSTRSQDDRRNGGRTTGRGGERGAAAAGAELTVSADGFGAGEGQSLEHPFGHADPGEYFAWAGATASWPNRTDPGRNRGLDDYFTRDFTRNIGAEIMGAQQVRAAARRVPGR